LFSLNGLSENPGPINQPKLDGESKPKQYFVPNSFSLILNDHIDVGWEYANQNSNNTPGTQTLRLWKKQQYSK